MARPKSCPRCPTGKLYRTYCHSVETNEVGKKYYFPVGRICNACRYVEADIDNTDSLVRRIEVLVRSVKKISAGSFQLITSTGSVILLVSSSTQPYRYVNKKVAIDLDDKDKAISIKVKRGKWNGR